jgi:hypothetical protein
LEIKFLYAVNICKSEEESKASQHGRYYTSEVCVITEEVLDESLDLLIGLARHRDKILHITILCHNQTINRPCHRTNPIVPDPPFRDFLNKTFLKSIHIEGMACGLVSLKVTLRKENSDSPISE